MSHYAVSLPSGDALPVLLPLAVLTLGLIGYCLVDLMRFRQAPYLPRWVWALLILLAIPWGAMGYLVAGRAARASGRQTAAAGPETSRSPAAATSPRPDPRPRADIAPLPDGHTRPGTVTEQRPIVVTGGLTRDYGGGAGLFGVDLRVPRGCVYGLVGPNGAGKTTLLSILTGTRHSSRGTVEIAAPRSAVAVCPDVPEFEPWLTAFEVVDLARHYVAPASGADQVRWALRTAGLSDAADRRVGGFSRGMTQRLGLAAALVGDPQLIMLDEPTSALDPAGRADILDLVASMRGTRTVIFSSHILDDVQRVADHVGVLRAGRLLYQGPTRALVNEHLTPSWKIRLGSRIDEVTASLLAQPWVRRVTASDAETLRVDADSMDHGEAGIPVVVAECHARLIAFEPIAADLEAAFLALTARQEHTTEMEQ